MLQATFALHILAIYVRTDQSACNRVHDWSGSGAPVQGPQGCVGNVSRRHLIKAPVEAYRFHPQRRSCIYGTIIVTTKNISVLLEPSSPPFRLPQVSSSHISISRICGISYCDPQVWYCSLSTERHIRVTTYHAALNGSICLVQSATGMIMSERRQVVGLSVL